MQPIPSPEIVLQIHREMIHAELARQNPRITDRPRPSGMSLTTRIRVRIGSSLIAIGERIDPGTRQLSRPGI